MHSQVVGLRLENKIIHITAVQITKENSFKCNEVIADFIIDSNPHKPENQPKQLHYQQTYKTYTKEFHTDMSMSIS